MSIDPADLEEAALGMVPERRAKLTSLLIRSLESAEDVDEKRIEGLWLEEAEERVRQIGAGEVELLSADEVLTQLRDRR